MKMSGSFPENLKKEVKFKKGVSKNLVSNF